MAKRKIAVAIDPDVLTRLDDLVARGGYASRSQAVEDAIEEKLQMVERTRLARECAKLDPKEEKALAEEGLAEELSEWPAY